MHGIIIFIKLCCLFVTMASAFKLYTFFFLWIDFHVFNQIQWFFLLHVPTLFISLSSCLSFLWITVFLPSFLIFAILSFFFFYCVTFSLLLLLLRFFDLSNGMVNAPFCASSPKINIHFASMTNCCRFAWYLCHYCAFEWFPMKIGNWIVCVWLSREVYRSVCCRQRQNENAIRSIEAFDSAPTIQFLSLFCFVWFGSGFTLSEERNCGGVRVTSPLDWCMSLKPHHSFSSVPFQVLNSIGHSILHVHIRSSKWQNFETNAPSIVCNLKLFLRSASISFITSVNIWFLFLSPWRWEMPTVQLRQPTLMLRNDWCSIFVI